MAVYFGNNLKKSDLKNIEKKVIDEDKPVGKLQTLNT